MIPTLLLALTTNDPVLASIAVLALYISVQQVENAVLVPKIQGEAVQLHPSLVIFALIVGGSIAGLLGAILAIPITAAARDVYRYLFHRLSDDVDAAPPPTPAAPTAPPEVAAKRLARRITRPTTRSNPPDKPATSAKDLRPTDD